MNKDNQLHKSLDVRQSELFACFMKRIGWKEENVEQTKIYLRKFPFIGYFAKIPRPSISMSLDKLDLWKKKSNIFQLKIAPYVTTSHQKYSNMRKKFFEHGFRIENNPFNPTTTIQIDLTVSEEILFHAFTSAKQRGVRRAIKHNIHVEDSELIDSFISIRRKQYSLFGYLLVDEMKKLWLSFFPNNASLLLAYHKSSPVAGILLLYYDHVAYYWFASSLPFGKQLFAPTLLVWEALKRAKRKGCIVFDFEGIYDDRFPEASKSWKGFTKFKEGFGGERVVFMENFVR